jgi:hypothetical protein
MAPKPMHSAATIAVFRSDVEGLRACNTLILIIAGER